MRRLDDGGGVSPTAGEVRDLGFFGESVAPDPIFPALQEGKTSWLQWMEDQRRSISGSGLWRTLRCFPAERLVSFASNDYLDLAHHPEVIAAGQAAMASWGAGSGSSRLIAGGRSVHEELEAELADWKGTERALLFSSGYTANLGLLTVLGGDGAVICSDQLNHASIIDGCRLSRAEVRVFPHRDLGRLEQLLVGTRRAVVVTETVFSMDGDRAPITELADLCRTHGAMLMTDEAHAVLDDHLALSGADVVRVGTLSKTLGSMGGFVAGSGALIDLLVNRARSQIFTTALAPSAAASALAALRILRSAEGSGRRSHLRHLVERLKARHPSQIVPIIVGGEDETMAAMRSLEHGGMLVPAIRPPSVPPGTSRLRISLSSAHTCEQVDALKVALSDLGLT